MPSTTPWCFPVPWLHVMLNLFGKATGGTGDQHQSVLARSGSFTAPCFLLSCSCVSFFTSCSPFKVVVPSESTLSLCSGHDFLLAFLLLSSFSLLLLLCWHGLILSSSSYYSTVMSFSWHLLPFLKRAFVELPETPLAVLECSGSVPTVPKSQWMLTETQEDPSEHREALFLLWGWLSTCTGCLERLWSLCVWRSSKTVDIALGSLC